MAYDGELLERVRDALDLKPGMTEKKMFGGICFLCDGHMLAGVSKDRMILRLGPEQGEAALKQKGVKIFEGTGRPMRGWIELRGQYLKKTATLQAWLNQAEAFVRTLSPK